MCGLPVLAAAGCFSSAGALPAVRWFDPLPALAAPPAPVPLRVTAAAHLGREFVVRVAAREVAFDGQHQWIAEPRDLVAGLLAGSGLAGDVHVTAFELDVTGEPRAVVRLIVRGTDGASRVVEASSPAADRSPSTFAQAMAAALADLQNRVASR